MKFGHISVVSGKTQKRVFSVANSLILLTLSNIFDFKSIPLENDAIHCHFTQLRSARLGLTGQQCYNYKEVKQGRNLQQNILLERGDVVLVP